MTKPQIDELLSPEEIDQRFDKDRKLLFFIDLSYSYGLLKKFDKTLLFSIKSIDLDPSNSTSYLNKGISLSALGKNEEAIVEYDNAIKINPQDASTYNNKGYSLFLLGRINEAIESASESIRLNENYAIAWYSRLLLFS